MTKFRITAFWLALIFVASAGFTQTAYAQQDGQLSVAGIFGNGMVLQQETAAAIWGQAEPKAKITIKTSWQKKATVATADKTGNWKTTIDTPKAGGPFTIEVVSGSQRKQFKNVLTGEVWFCTGQSNMQWKMRGFGANHWKDDVQKANHPGIRLCEVQQKLALEPQADNKVSWSACNPKRVLSFSAVAYFFGNRLHQELKVPVGLISTNWGGSSAEAWMNPEVLEKNFPEFKKTLNGYDGLIKQHGVVHANRGKPKGFNQRMPGVLYNQMIHPFVPFSCRGVIWYQGESNVKEPIQYRKLFPALIENWRAEWGQGDFPFYFVQIAPFDYKTEPLPVAMLREAQFQTLRLPNTGMVVTMDIGQADNIHPKKKKPVGERLALLALAKNYGRTKLVYSGPQFVGHEIEKKQVRLKFEHVGGGLKSRDDKALTHFTIAGKNRVFHPAEAKVDGESIVVSSPKVARPAAVRFAWGNADEPNLTNAEGLPSSSFRTDDWEIKPVTPKRPAPRKPKTKAK